MKTIQMTNPGRLLILLGALATLFILFFPMWQIQLAAPQYPEGLVLLIYPDRLGGNVDIINGLNHYIGMKPLHVEDFPEFNWLPWIVRFFFVLLLITAIAGRRKLLNMTFILFLVFGIVAMYDFWRWEYNYGHNLNPDAAIVVPGMAYQPPLIGFKQLLNFGAYSIPDTGGWLFILVGLLLLTTVIMEWRWFKKSKGILNPFSATLMLTGLLLLTSCKSAPQPLLLGKDNCNFCMMTISDNRFGAEIITKKGKIYKFDDAGCALSFLQAGSLPQKEVGEIYFTDFSGDHSLILSGQAYFLKSPDLKGPMGGEFTAFSNQDSLHTVLKRFGGNMVSAETILKP